MKTFQQRGIICSTARNVIFSHREGADLVVSNVAFGDNGTAWVVDVVGRVWFTTGVRWDNPSGTGKWWQVRFNNTEHF